MSAEIVLENIRTRRTTKPILFNEKDIDQNTLGDILEAANWAPNHGRTEPWRLFLINRQNSHKYASLVQTVWDETPEELKKPGKLEKWLSNIPKASHIIAFGLQKSDTPIPLVEEICAVSCAAQNMMLVANAHGVASYWSSGIAHFPTAARAFGLEGSDDCMLGFLHLGYSDKAPSEACRKTPISAKISTL